MPSTPAYPIRIDVRGTMRSWRPLNRETQFAPEFQPDCAFHPENHNSRNPVLQFADIPRPIPLIESGQNGLRQLWDRPSKIPRKLLRQILTDLRDVRFTLPERRQLQNMAEATKQLCGDRASAVRLFHTEARRTHETGTRT